MFEFITQHLSEISNFSMAIATVIMVFYTKKSIDEMKISRKEANKANIVFYVADMYNLFFTEYEFNCTINILLLV